jgi:rSAM/selenodomain-associated transferase 2
MTLSRLAVGNRRISVIIPVLNERAHIHKCLENLQTQGLADSRQIIVVDGDAEGSTIDLVRDGEVLCLKSAPGRGRQMNAGAAVADGEILLFLHVDTVLPAGALENISGIMATQKYVAGAFDLAIDSKRLFLKYIAFRARCRSRQNRIPYGDQAIFIRRDYFERLGGFSEIPIMEDVDLMRRIKKDRQKIHILRDRVLTSPRRWEAEGPLYTTMRNQFLLSLYYLGVSPERLSRLYGIQNGGPAGSGRCEAAKEHTVSR